MSNSEFLRALGKTFPLMRVLGFDVRLHWTVFIYFLIALHIYSEENGEAAPVVFAVAAVVQLFAIVLVHELGHALAARRLNLPVTHIELSPIGGLACLASNPRSPREELFVTFWGPAVHPVLLLVAGIPYLMVENGSLQLGLYLGEFLNQFVQINFWLLVFNLIPAFPMDGGRILRALLASRMYAAQATLYAALIGQVASVIFVVVALVYFEGFRIVLLIIGIRNFIVCERAKTEARYEDPYASDGSYLDLYEPSVDEYLRPAPRRRRPSFITRFFRERARRRREQEARHEAEVKARVDEILERVSEVGFEGLTVQERSFLKKASDLYRRSR